MNKPNGNLLRKKPYLISKDGDTGMKVHINDMSDLDIGDKVYQVRRDDGIIMLIPEEIYNSL